MDTKDIVFTPEQVRFLEHYARNGVIAHALEEASVDRATFKSWKRDPIFEEAVKDAKETSIELAEGELRRRGLGYEEPLTYQGSVVYERDPQTGEPKLDENFEPIPFKVRKYSDRLLEVYMKANDEKYKDKGRIEHTGEGGGAIKNELKVQWVLPEGKSEEDYE